MCNKTYPAFQSIGSSDSRFTYNGFNPHSPLKTRGGEDVAILTTNGPGQAPVIGMIFTSPQNNQFGNKLHRWNYHGKSYDANGTTPRSLDLEKNVIRAFNWSLHYKTKDGRNVTVLTNTRNGSRNVVALVGGKQVMLYYPNGTVQGNGQESEFDLVNI